MPSNSSLQSSPLYHLPYYPLAKYLFSLAAMSRRDRKYSMAHHQEAIDILLDRMERARLGNRGAWDKLMDVPVTVDGQKGVAIGIQTGISCSASCFLVNIYLPSFQKSVSISSEADGSQNPTRMTPFTFDRTRLPRLSLSEKKRL